MPRVIDPWVNVDMGRGKPPEWLVRVKEDYFKAGDEFFRSLEPQALVEQMDAAGVEKAILSVAAEAPSGRTLAFAEKYPDRFAYAVNLRPTGQMREVWALEELAARHPVVMARVVPFAVDRPPTDPLYLPLYVKCVELDLPVSINTGIPGPPVPGECQHPIHLDRVCLQFPELRVCMAHGADPWWGVAIRLMIKYRNLHLMTSAYSPKYLPPELIHYMNTRGQDRILFASDHPVLSFQRCIREAQALDLRPGVLEKYLYENASRLFFSERRPHRCAVSGGC
jgi:predicted TIM-barrel fold metal-dependent hydrolase